MTGMCGMSTDTFPSTTTEHYDLSDVLIKNIHSQPGAVAEFGWVEVPKQQYWSPRIEEKLGGWKAKRLVGAEELHRLVDCIICLHHWIHRPVRHFCPLEWLKNSVVNDGSLFVLENQNGAPWSFLWYQQYQGTPWLWGLHYWAQAFRNGIRSLCFRNTLCPLFWVWRIPSRDTASQLDPHVLPERDFPDEGP